ncbi:MAG: hypothetical protein FJ060_07035 [Cyanobacteria bacterium K_Offshore_0m_m2_072]|nr:hypothetical protein [Cyanobacteria bacterium K_Offshore_0m_m2_072]
MTRRWSADRSLPAALLLLGSAAMAPALAGRPGQQLPRQPGVPPQTAAPSATDPAIGPGHQEDGFGRWESTLRRCQLLWPGQGPAGGRHASSCLKLRLDQSIEGMLRVRFINPVGGSRFASEEITFAGLLLKHDQPMRCRQGACDPIWPLRIQVHGVASRRFDGRGLAEQLPSNHLAKGSCQLGPVQLTCQAKGSAGQNWQASAHLPGVAAVRQREPQPSPKRL